MSQRNEPNRIAALMLSWLDLELISCTAIQGLWAGYGHICAVTAKPAANCASEKWHRLSRAQGNNQDSTIRLVLKIVHPPTKTGDEGHLRKMFSYEVEQYFYDEVAPRLGDSISVAQCFASTRSMRQKAIDGGIDHVMATLLNDLRPEFPVAGQERAILSSKQVYAALAWLAKFHSSSWAHLPQDLSDFLLPPLEEAARRQRDAKCGGTNLWLNGGYTYLATRQAEYKLLAHDHFSEWSDIFCSSSVDGSPSLAEAAADFLIPRGRHFETYIHGDVKSENLFSTESGDDVVFFDFQYAGIGLGVCDLAKLFTCSVPLKLLTSHKSIPSLLKMDENETKLLERYWSTLMSNRPQHDMPVYDWDVFLRHWETALVDWCRFQASWGFWGNRGWLEARVRFITQDEDWKDWLQRQRQASST